MFVLDAPAGVVGTDWAPSATPPARGDFDVLAGAVLAHLLHERDNWIPDEDSRELEERLPSPYRALAERGFERCLQSTHQVGGKGYRGFWRRAEEGAGPLTWDTVTNRTGGEDGRGHRGAVGQGIDDLGHSDGVINVRAAGGRRRL